ncbi:MAG: PilZ domain-containing protein [Candidatus Omnitrophota bacterium]
MYGRQRRRYLRVVISIDVEFKELNDPAGVFIAKTIDISAGGMRVILPEYKEIGSVFSMSFVLENQHTVADVQGTIVWNKENMDTDNKPVYEAGVLYTAIDLETRHNVIKFVYEELRSKHNL